ncbi:hypothetical protein BJ684DRAFT_18669 [Piptocephalis cylindrospora]|uniref:G-protein coupled receptors family 1 profile domain-containing protein n=1 Tax=Piptocephalis cylindrospora TaxID=1907219 RepID=A0A4V1IYL4_9FUNG|nr:hypothetical protein BJ684DRAFT_18669 [Piptocephalis cylindrospora]|eukprot:RKP14969.1 hypothetical protein BJ684DRAFT_18669 [Piptocephalis cylindrospora]
MDLTLDPLYNATFPAETPCRWLVNIRHCKDEEYYVRGTLMGIVQAMVMIFCSVCTFILTGIKGKRYSGKWSTGAWIHLSSLIQGSIHLILSMVMILDPPTPYCVRYLLQFSFLLTHFCTMPYLSSLISTRFTIVWKPKYQKHCRLRAQRVLLVLPWAFLSFVITLFISGLLLDLRYPLEATIVFSIGMFMCSLGNAIFIWVCWMYGYRFSRHLSRHIKDMDPSLFVQSSVLTAPSREGAHLWSYLFSDDPCSSTPCEVETKVIQTLVDGQRILGRMSVLNFFFVVVNTLCLLFAMTSMLFPVDMYTVPLLSKILFFIASPNRTILRSVVTITMLAMELYQPHPRCASGEKSSLVERLCFHSNWYHQVHSSKRLKIEKDQCPSIIPHPSGLILAPPDKTPALLLESEGSHGPNGPY